MIRRPFASVRMWKGMGWFLVGLAVAGGPVRGQRLGPEGDDAEVPGRAAPQVADDGPRGERVDGRLEFVGGAHAPEVVPVGGEGEGARAGRFLLHDQRGLDA